MIGGDFSGVRIYINEDTFVCSIEPDKNYSTSPSLKLAKVSNSFCQYVKSNILIKANLSNYNIEVDEIDRVYLCLYLRNCRASELDTNNISILRNCNDFDYQTVTWNTRPKASTRMNSSGRVKEDNSNKNTCCNRDIFNERFLCLDITAYAFNWIRKPQENNGMTLELGNLCGFIEFDSSRGENRPFLDIVYKKNYQYKNNTLMQLQLTQKSEQLLPYNENVVFDSILTNNPRNILYNQQNGEITLFGSGDYYINWWVGIGGVGIIPSVTFGIVDTSQIVNIIGAATINSSGQIVGNACIKVENVPITIKLVNLSGDTVQYSFDTNVQADITIIKTD